MNIFVVSQELEMYAITTILKEAYYKTTKDNFI